MQWESFRLGEYLVHPRLNTVAINGTETTIEPKAMEVLLYLASRPGEVLDKESILRAVWRDTSVTDEVLTRAISNLRKVLEDDPARPRYIQTIQRRGYRLVAPVVRTGDKPVKSSGREAPSRRALAGWVIVAAVIAAGLGAAAGVLVMSRFSAAPSAPVVSVIRLEAGQWLGGLMSPQSLQRPTRTDFALSHDGRFVVFSGIRGNPDREDRPSGTIERIEDARLYLRRLDRIEVTPITGTEGAFAPFLSPDDRWVAFWSLADRWKLFKVPVDGGVPTLLVDTTRPPVGGNWADDDRILFSSGVRAGLSAIPAAGGKPEALTVPDKEREEVSHRLPHALPGSKGVVFTVMRHVRDPEPKLAVLDLGTRRWRHLLDDAADARYDRSGRLVFVRRGKLMAVAFDPDRLATTGEPVPVAEDVLQALNMGNIFLYSAAGQFSLSDRGSLIYARGGITPDQQCALVWVDLRGHVDPITTAASAAFPALSNDGRRIAWITEGTKRGVWSYDLARKSPDLLNQGGLFLAPVWNRDGTALVYAWSPWGVLNIYSQAVDRRTEVERLITSEFEQIPVSRSPDGAVLALVEIRPDGPQADIVLLDVRTRQTKVFLNSPANEFYPYISPDGRWLAHTSDESGEQEVYVRSFPDGALRLRISDHGGIEPAWSPDGNKLFYRRGKDQWWVVDFRTEGGRFVPGRQRLLFELAGIQGGDPARTWDVSPDGERFLMVQYAKRKNEPVTELVLMLNWREALAH